MDYSLAFNQALKNVVVALPQRPPHETAEDVVRALKKDDLDRTRSHLTKTTTRCTTAHSLAASASTRAILEHFDRHI